MQQLNIIISTKSTEIFVKMKELTFNDEIGVHQFKVHVPRLLEEVTNCGIPRTMGVLKVPLNMFQKYLVSVSERCAEINDPVLNKLMCNMALYEQSDLGSKYYDKKMIDQVNKNYKDFMKL